MYIFHTHTHKQEHGCWTLDFFVSDIKLQAIYKVIHTSNYDGHISKYVCKIGKYNQRGTISDFLKFVGPSITRTGNTAKYAGPGLRKKLFVCVFCFAPEIGKCNWYAGTITVNLELDSASNDIYFLNMQLFPW